jgi:hypothetical protein
MRVLLAALALTVCAAALPRNTSAAEPAPLGLIEKTSRPSAAGHLLELLQRLGVGLISPAQAAECTREGETCTSNEQCCPGLECSGGPQATCATED